MISVLNTFEGFYVQGIDSGPPITILRTLCWNPLGGSPSLASPCPHPPSPPEPKLSGTTTKATQPFKTLLMQHRTLPEHPQNRTKTFPNDCKESPEHSVTFPRKLIRTFRTHFKPLQKHLQNLPSPLQNLPTHPNPFHSKTQPFPKPLHGRIAWRNRNSKSGGKL